MSEKKLIWIFAGETSGDIYGARLAKEIRKQLPDAHIAGMGASRMQEAGVDIMVDSADLGVVGLIEVLKHIFTFIGIFRMLVQRAEKERPDAVILIDYPGFNIRFAKQMYKRGIPVIWYISPQVWAWRKQNIPRLAKYCRKMLVIFPFEPEVYSHVDLDVQFVGHPLVEIVGERKDPEIKRDANLVVLLPGSRDHEIERLFNPMLETVSMLHRSRPKLRFTVAAPREKIANIAREMLEKFRRKHPDDRLPDIEISCGETARLMQEASTGLAASGTVTVECAIAGLPLVVVYRLNPITFSLARLVITLFRGFFTMVNIIADKTVFEEYLQFQVTPEALVPAVERILPGGERREEVEKGIREVVEALTPGGEGASACAAKACVDFVKSQERK